MTLGGLAGGLRFARARAALLVSHGYDALALALALAYVSDELRFLDNSGRR